MSEEQKDGAAAGEGDPKGKYHTFTLLTKPDVIYTEQRKEKKEKMARKKRRKMRPHTPRLLRKDPLQRQVLACTVSSINRSGM